MGSNDYGVIVYKFLSKIHNGLKNSYVVHLEDLINDTKTFPIDERYWRTILKGLIDSGYIDGLCVVNKIGGCGFKEDSDGITLTPLGAEYLEENALMAKARNFVGPVADIASLLIK